MQAVPITANVVSLNPTDGDEYSIQHYVIKKKGCSVTCGRSHMVMNVEINNLKYIFDVLVIGETCPPSATIKLRYFLHSR
jgi:hypothetical protein